MAAWSPIETGRKDPDLPCMAVGASASDFLKPFAITAEAFAPGNLGLIVVGHEALTSSQEAEVLEAASKGATVLLLPGAALGRVLGLRTREERLFLGKASANPLLAGLSAGDLFLKEWVTVQAVSGPDWETVASPGLVAVRRFGQGRLVACVLDPTALQGRPRVKALRVWNALLTNLGARRDGFSAFLAPSRPLYEENPWEKLPPYIDW